MSRAAPCFFEILALSVLSMSRFAVTICPTPTGPRPDNGKKKGGRLKKILRSAAPSGANYSPHR